MLKLFIRSKEFFESATKRKKIEDKKESEKQSELELMFCLNYGIGLNKDEKRAKDLCMRQAAKGNEMAIGFQHYMGWETKKDLDKSFEKFQEFSLKYKDVKEKDKEMGYCLNMIAYFFKEGKGVEKDMQKTIDLYQKSIKLGNSMAMNNLAYLYKCGKGVTKNVKKAITLYEKAISMGNISSMYNLAYLYEEGRDVSQDMKKAVRLYKKAIKMNNSMAMNNLAMIYKNGKGVEKKIEKATVLYEKAIDLKNKNAMYNLAYLYEEGKDVIRDLEKAIQLYTKSCELGNSSAMNNLAMIYKKGNGIEKNVSKSINLLEKATELGNKNAMINLALIYEEDNSPVQNFELSASYFFTLFNMKDENQSMFKRKMFDVLSSGRVEWKTDYHFFWKPSHLLNNQIITLLLISKKRNESKNQLCSVFVKGIIFILIKFLCHTSQKK